MDQQMPSSTDMRWHPEVCWVDEHLLVVVGASRHNQLEPDGPGSLASWAIKDLALQISAGRVGQAQTRRLGGRPATSSAPAASACKHSGITSSASPAGAGTPPRQARTWGAHASG
jgi:hypothetical protein